MQMIKESMTWASGVTAAVTHKLYENGMIRAHVFSCNNCTNGITFTVEILDNDSNSIYSLAAIPENATTLTSSLAIPVNKEFSVKITPSGDPGVSTAITYIKLFIESLK